MKAIVLQRENEVIDKKILNEYGLRLDIRK